MLFAKYMQHLVKYMQHLVKYMQHHSYAGTRLRARLAVPLQSQSFSPLLYSQSWG